MVTSVENDAGLKSQFDVRVAYPERIYSLLKIPTPTKLFRGFFEPLSPGDIPGPHNSYKVRTDKWWERPTSGPQFLKQAFDEGRNLILRSIPLPLEALSNAYSLGGVSLEPPLSHLSVSVITDGSRFSSLSLVRFDSKYMEAQGQSELPLPEDLQRQRFKLDKKDDRLVILGEGGNPEFEIAKVYTQVGSMLVEDGLSIGFGHGDLAMAREVSTPEEIQAWMEQYALILKVVVNGFYEGANQPSPDKTFFLWA